MLFVTPITQWEQNSLLRRSKKFANGLKIRVHSTLFLMKYTSIPAELDRLCQRPHTPSGIPTSTSSGAWQKTSGCADLK